VKQKHCSGQSAFGARGRSWSDSTSLNGQHCLSLPVRLSFAYRETRANDESEKSQAESPGSFDLRKLMNNSLLARVARSRAITKTLKTFPHHTLFYRN
jgi:hypothetical protein